MKETCKNKAILTRSCKISARIIQSLARSCKTSCKNLQEFHFSSTRVVFIQISHGKLPKFFEICNSCMVYLLKLGTQFSTFLKYFFGKQNNHLIALSVNFLRVPLLSLFSYFLVFLSGLCRAYYKSLLALFWITTIRLSVESALWIQKPLEWKRYSSNYSVQRRIS